MNEATIQQSLPPGTTGKMPVQVGKYEVRGLVGQGSCGLVYKGFDPFVRRDVAIKTIHSAPGGDDDIAASVEHAFFTEARAAGMLSHPHIVSLYDAGSQNGTNYLVMEYVDGETLLPWCNKAGPRMGLDRVVDLIFKCAKALDYAHGKGVLHRDIKPSNIMLTHDGVPKLMDFSVAELNEPGAADRRQVAVGSPLYMSPEQVRRQPPQPASDLYSLGVVMYQLLTGETPYHGADLPLLFAAIRNQPVPRVEEKRPDLPRDICAVVSRLLAKDPDQRYQAGAELADDLLRIFDRLKQADANLSRRESRDSLRTLRFFDAFSDDDIEEILSASKLLTFAAGAEIVREGEIDAAFYLIARGNAEVRKGSTVIDTLMKGDCFGEIAFLTAQRRTATVVAATQVLALRVNASLLEQVTRDCQLRFYKTFTNTLIYRLSLTSAKLQAARTAAG
ncbi:MAG: protein kinase [Nevskia sp.]|nr:protein kinase [Nevskia sp.]